MCVMVPDNADGTATETWYIPVDAGVYVNAQLPALLPVASVSPTKHINVSPHLLQLSFSGKHFTLFSSCAGDRCTTRTDTS